MGDPITLAVVGGSVGAMMSPRDPLKGAMLGAAGGYGAGALVGGAAASGMAAGGASAGAASGGVASAAGTAGLSAGGGALAPGLGASRGAGGTAIGTTTGLEAPAMTGVGLAPAATGLGAGEASLATMTGAGTAPTGFMANTLSGFGKDLSGANNFIQTNPVLAGMAFNTASSMMQPTPMAPAQPSPLAQGRTIQGDYSLLSLLPQQPRQAISLI